MNYSPDYLPKYSFLQIEKKDFPLSWWVKITTAIPSCTYYFGPFDCQEEAAINQYVYVEDLMIEKAKGISVEIVKEQPIKLTT